MKAVWGARLSVILTLGAAACYTEGVCADSSNLEMRPGSVFKDCPDCPEMIVIPAGRFQMGSPDSEKGRESDEGPAHAVTLGRSFALGKTHITRGQYAAFVAATGYDTGNRCGILDTSKPLGWEVRNGHGWRNPGFAQQDNHPAVCLSWNDAKAYVQWLALKTGKSYRLPSEAEWEYGARAGTTTARYWGDSADQACGYANVADKTAKSLIPGTSAEDPLYKCADSSGEVLYSNHKNGGINCQCISKCPTICNGSNCRNEVNWRIHDCTDDYAYTSPVANFHPNAFGLYDMIGNVWQWTADCWNFYNQIHNQAPNDGSAMKTGDCQKRILRGGSWNNSPEFARSAKRLWHSEWSHYNDIGFRLARTLP